METKNLAKAKNAFVDDPKAASAVRLALAAQPDFWVNNLLNRPAEVAITNAGSGKREAHWTRVDIYVQGNAEYPNGISIGAFLEAHLYLYNVRAHEKARNSGLPAARESVPGSGSLLN